MAGTVDPIGYARSSSWTSDRSRRGGAGGSVMAGRTRTLWGSLTAPTLPPVVAAVLVLLSLPLLRPGVFGESTALVGCALVLAGTLAALLRRERVRARPVPAVSLLVGVVAVAYLWLIGH